MRRLICVMWTGRRRCQRIVDSMPAVRDIGRGRPRRRPIKVHADKGYDIPRVRRYLHRRRITAWIARIGMDSSAHLGGHRWVVERTLGWLPSYKRLALRYDRHAVTTTALARLAVTPHLRPPATEARGG